MKKVFLLALCLISFSSYAQSGGGSEGGEGGSEGGGGRIIVVPAEPRDPIEDEIYGTVHNPLNPPSFDVPFSAQILSDKSILVTSQTVTTFAVAVRRQDNLAIVYSGETHNSTIHITTKILNGTYSLEIFNGGTTYTGNFQIANSDN